MKKAVILKKHWQKITAPEPDNEESSNSQKTLAKTSSNTAVIKKAVKKEPTQPVKISSKSVTQKTSPKISLNSDMIRKTVKKEASEAIKISSNSDLTKKIVRAKITAPAPDPQPIPVVTTKCCKFWPQCKFGDNCKRLHKISSRPAANPVFVTSLSVNSSLPPTKKSIRDKFKWIASASK